MLGGMADVTRILSAIESGDPTAAAELLPLVYDELRKLAAARLSNGSRGEPQRHPSSTFGLWVAV
jgi:DNA-binding GntR family transcriptional regulator